MANKEASADHLLTSGKKANWPDFPSQGDWGGWVDVWCRQDTGNIDCVPICLRHHVEDIVTAEGWPKHPGMVPNTPYKVARWFQFGAGNLLPPWIEAGLLPEEARQVWEDMISEKPAKNVPRNVFSASDLYFIRSDAGPIKIGVSIDVQKRLRALQTSNPHRLSIAGVKRGAGMEETAYHQRFAAYRLEGEWFSPAPEIEAEIAALSASPTPLSPGAAA